MLKVPQGNSRPFPGDAILDLCIASPPLYIFDLSTVPKLNRSSLAAYIAYKYISQVTLLSLINDQRSHGQSKTKLKGLIICVWGLPLGTSLRSRTYLDVVLLRHLLIRLLFRSQLAVMSRTASVLSFVCSLLAISTNCIHYTETLSFDVFKNCTCNRVNGDYFDINCTARLAQLGGSLPPNSAFPARMVFLYAFYIGRVQCFLHEFVPIQ